MRHLKMDLISVSLLLGILYGANSCETSETAVLSPVDTAVSKTIIVDVRTREEWIDDGHAGCSVNYPLPELDKKIDSIKAFDKVVLVCRSGNRAEVAKELLEQAGIKNIENKGAWQNIRCK